MGDLDGRSCPRSSRFLTALLIGREELKETGTEPVLLIAARSFPPKDLRKRLHQREPARGRSGVQILFLQGFMKVTRT